MAIISDKTMKAKKLAITTNIENISCERGFMSLKAINAITIDFWAKITEEIYLLLIVIVCELQ